jgi:transcriptional regulator with XRE-family HTH domain
VGRRARDAKVAAEFGARVRALRLQAGLSQESLAHAARVHRTYVGHVERGETTATLYGVVRFAEALGVDPADLVSGLRTGPQAHHDEAPSVT